MVFSNCNAIAESSALESRSMRDTHQRNRRPSTKAGKWSQRFRNISSLQCLSHVVSAERTRWKLFWMLMLLATLCGCCYHIWSITTTFLSRDTTVSVHLAHGQAHFPAVRVCSLNPIRQHAIIAHKHNLTNVTAEQVEAYEAGSKYLGWGFHDIMRALSTEERSMLGHQQENMFVRAKHFANARISSDRTAEFAQSWSAEYGNCYTFNSPATVNKSFKAYSGYPSGLHLILYAESHEYIKRYRMDRGFVLTVYPYNGRDDMLTGGLTIATGQYTQLGVTQSVVNRLPPPYGECDQEYADSFLEIYGHEYSVQACNQSCLPYHIVEKCGCYDLRVVNYYYSDQQIANFRVCTSEQETLCVEHLAEQMKAGNLTCSCPPPCREVKYNVETSTSTLSVRDAIDRFQLYYCNSESSTSNESVCDNITDSSLCEKSVFVAENLATVYISFRDVSYKSYTESIAYDRAQFVSDIGGTLGLWLGASVFSIFELFELFSKMGKCTLWQKKGDNETIKDEL